MTTEEIQELIEESSCYQCLAISLEQQATLALEARWLLSLDPAADVSVQALDEGCTSCIGGDLFDAAEINLLSGIGSNL